MTVLITGGGGFVGRAVALALRSEGRAVRTFARGDYPELAEAGIDHRRGRIEDAEAVRAAARGCETVFHTAAKVGVAGTRAEFEAVNVRGTEHVIAACRAEGVGRLVFTSSPSVVLGGTDVEGADESLAYPADHGAHYPATKAEAERRVLDADGEGLRTISLRPHIIWGPGDTSLLPRVARRAHRLRRIGPGGKKTDVCFIDDCVQAHRLAEAALRDRPEVVGGKPYFISSGEPVEIWAFVDLLLQAAGKPKLTKSISLPVASFAAGVIESLHALTGARGEPMLTRWVVRELATAHWFDISAARRDLGYRPQVGLEEGQRRLSAWITETGWSA